MQTVADANLKPLGYAQFDTTNLTTAMLLTSTPAAGIAMPAATRAVLITVETQGVRWTDDGSTTPTSAVGMFIPSGSTFLYTGKPAAFKAIRAAAGAIMNCTFYA